MNSQNENFDMQKVNIKLKCKGQYKTKSIMKSQS